MTAIATSTLDALDERIEDILTMYAAGVMSRMENDYTKSLGWTQRAEQAAYQLGQDTRQIDVDSRLSFGVPKLDRAFQQGCGQESTCVVYDLSKTQAKEETRDIPISA